ncbi:MAG: hypothetical protein ABJE95_08305 [Byssovorax sp.]
MTSFRCSRFLAGSFSAALALTVPLASGCSGGGATGTSGGGGAGGSSPNACPQNGVVPPNMRDVERSGEGLVATTFGEYPARMADWKRAATVLSILKDVWTKSKTACPGLPAAGSKAVDDAIVTLDKAIAAQDQKSAVYAANAVGLAAPPLFDYFKPDAPKEIVRMDAVYRQVGIDAHFGDWAATQVSLDSLSTDFTASKAAIEKRVPTCHRVGGTQTIVGDIEQSLGIMKTSVPAKDVKATETETESGALQIDTLELLFDCPPDGAPPKTGLGAKCKATSDCGTNEVCDTANAGGTCAPDPATASLGNPCSTTVDCGSDSRSACLTEAGDKYPGGYCAMEPCDDIQVCAPGGTCVSQPFETPGCLKACKADADCRTSEGYVCQLFPTTPPGGFGPSDHACGFPCTDDAGCTSPLKCTAATGKCTP